MRDRYGRAGTCGVCVDDPGAPLPILRTYVCAGCGQEVTWCDGAGDDMLEACDDCWCLAHAGEGQALDGH